MKHSTKIVLDTRKALSTGKYPVKIRVGFGVIKKGKTFYKYDYYGTDVEMFKEEFDKLVYELKLDVGPGYRVYYAKEGRTVVILLEAGDKKSQAADIQPARIFWLDYLRRSKK